MVKKLLVSILMSCIVSIADAELTLRVSEDNGITWEDLDHVALSPSDTILFGIYSDSVTINGWDALLSIPAPGNISDPDGDWTGNSQFYRPPALDTAWTFLNYFGYIIYEHDYWGVLNTELGVSVGTGLSFAAEFKYNGLIDDGDVSILLCGVNGPPGEDILDVISVVWIPEPVTLSLLVLGGVGMLGKRRR